MNNPKRRRLILAVTLIVTPILVWFLRSQPQLTRMGVASPVTDAALVSDAALVIAPVVDSAEGPVVPEVASAPPADFGAWAAEKVIPPDFEKLQAFDGWLARWQAAAPDQRAAMEEEGIQLAAARRPEFKALIVTDPKRALETAVPRVVRQDLPERIVALLETPVSAVGNYDVYMGRPAPGMPMPDDGLTLRYFEAQGVSYQAHVFGEMEPVMSRKQIPLQGVAVDRPLAVAESPVRQLETGERIPAGTIIDETCPVSGKTTEAVAEGLPVTEETPTVEVGGKLIALCNGSHVEVVDQKYRTLVQAAGPGSAAFFMDAFPGTSSRAIGNFRCLYIRATYPDQMAPPNTEDQAVADMTNTAKFYLDSSYGKMTTTSTVTPLIVLPQTLKWYQDKDAEENGLGVLQTQAREEARKLGYDSTQYDCIILRVAGGLRSGASWGGGDSVWLGWGGMDVINHECGHSLGLGHANYWATTDGTAYGNGSNQEYGNPFDVMGGGGGYGAHYNSGAKRNLGWLPSSYVHFPKTNGIFRLTAFDQPTLEEGKFYSLNIAKDSTIQYAIEYHTNISTLSSQAMVLYGGRLIDTTPGSSGGKNDAGIQLGRTFSDLEADLHFTQISKNNTTPPSIDVAVFRGPFPGNVAPTVALSASATTVSVGATVTFTAAASDANGDSLAYYWEFDDGSSAANSAVVSKTFSSAAQITAMVTVSDMKGLTTRRHVVINVGTHGKQLVSGQITTGGTPLPNVRVSITNGKFAFTDADGNYALAGVSSGSQTLTATLNGYTFTPLFTNPLLVATGTNTANWTADGSTFVSLTKTADATEGGANGSFTLTRTGDPSLPLVVRVTPAAGTAVKGTDYTFTPDYANDGSYRTFTILAGQASLVISVAAINDTIQEGPETITLQLASNGNYLQTSANSVVMTINDDDTILPQVAVTAPGPYAMEPAQAGSFLFTRTGATTVALNLSVAWTGTATNGSDYVTLPGTVTIPAGQSSVTLAVTPIDDSLIEVPETIIATINTGAAYLRDSSATTATVTLSDDDTPVVTTRALDANASEAGPQSGVFLIERSGSTAAALKVYYGLSGSAFHGTDYMRLTGEVTIPAGATSAPVVITPYDDGISEGTEDVTLAVATFNNAYSIGADSQATLTITDNGGLPVVSVRAGTTGTEGGSNSTVIFRLMGTGSGNVTVNYSVSGTATAGSDYTALPGTVSIPANGPYDQTVTIPIINDTTPEPTETVIVKLLPGTGYLLYNDTVAEAAIRDNDSGADRVAVSPYQSNASEPATVGKFYFSRPGTVGALTVNYALSGTATSGVDYTGLTGSVVIPDTASGVIATFTPIDDTIAEGTETVTVTILSAAGYSVDRPASATLELADNDVSSVTVGFQSGSSVTSELPGASGQYRDIPVILSAASADAVTVQCVAGAGTIATGDDVDWAFVDAANGDAIIPTALLTFPPGTTSRNVRLKIKNDGVSEGAEVAVLELRAPRFASLSSSLAKHSMTIFDDTIPNLITEERWSNQNVYTNQTWSSSTPSYTGFLTGFTPAQNVADNYSRRLTGQVVAPATGGYTFWIASDDASRLYLSTTASAAQKVQIASVSGWVDFQEWDKNTSQKSATIQLTAGQSYYMEVQHQEGTGGDHVSVAWSGPGFSREAITGDTPDNAPRSVRFAVSATTRRESDGTEPLLMAFLDRPAGSTPITVDFTVGGTATAGSDYLLSPGTLTFNKGEQSKLLPFTILADSVGESPEVVVVTLVNPVGAQLGAPVSHSITLLDSDAPTVATVQFTATSAMSSGTVLGSVAATVASGRSVTGWAILAGNEGNVFALSAAGQVSLLAPGALPSPGTRQLLVRATDSAGSTGDGSVNIVCNPPATAGVTEKRYAGSTAYNTQTWTGTPNYSGSLPTFTTPQDVADNYSRRLTGYVQPQATGSYTFWIASDDDSRLFLSTDTNAANKVQIGSVSGWVNYQSWDSQPSQKSGSIALEAGKVYWMEVHHLEGSGGDHASVAWAGPGFSRRAIGASEVYPNFSSPPSAPSIALTSPSSGQAFTPASTITLTAEVVGGSVPVTAVEFYRGSTLIGTDSSAPYSISWNNPPAGSHVLTARAVNNGGSTASSGIPITVTGSNSAPAFTTKPIAKANAISMVAYSGQSLAGSATDPDAGDSITYSKISGPAWLTVASDGALGGTPAIADQGPNAFTVRVTDSSGLFDEATLNIQVVPNTKADNTIALNLGSSWTSGSAPDATRMATWDGAYNTAGSLSAALPGSAVSWKGISIGSLSGSAAGLVSIGGTGAAVASSQLTVGDGGIVLSTANQDLVINSATTVLNGNQTWNIGSGRNLRFGITGTGSANANVDGSGTIIISGTGLVDLNQGGTTGFSDAAGYAGFSGKWQVNAGATLRGVRHGATAFGTNTAADTITLNGGTLAVGGISGTQGNWTWNTNVTLAALTTSAIDQQLFSGSGRHLKLNGSIAGSGNLVFKETGANNSFDSDDLGFIVTSDNSMSGVVTIGGAVENGISGRLTSLRLGGIGGTDLSTTSGTTGSLGTAAVINNGVLTLSHSNVWTLANAISGTGKVRVGGSVAGIASQEVTLSGASSYSGGTEVAAGIVRVASNDTALGSGTVVFTGNATLATASGGGARSLANALTLNSGTTTTLNSGNAGLTLAGNIGGAGNLTTAGTGTTVLSGSNNYSGTTTVVSGSVLRITGTHTGTGAVTVAGTLAGNGTLAAATNVSGILSPGVGVGTLTFGSLTLADLSTIAWQASDWNGAAGSGYDRVVAATLDLSTANSITVALSELALANFAESGRTFTLVQAAGGITGFSVGKFVIDRSAFPSGTGNWRIQKTGNAIELVYTPLNRAPVFNSNPITGADATEDSPYSASLASSVTDPDDGEVLTFSKVSGPAWISVAADGSLSGTPGNSDVGMNNIQVSVIDSGGLSAAALLKVAVINTNDAPTFLIDPILVDATQDVALSGQLDASDIDVGDSLTFTKISGPAWLAVSSSGGFSGTPTNSQVGQNNFVVRVTDSAGAFDEAALTITVANVNDAPVFTTNPTNKPNATTYVAYTGQSLAGAATDVDAGDSLSYSKISGPTWLTVAADGSLAGTPDDANAGVNSFVIRVTDAAGATDDATLNITVTSGLLAWWNFNEGSGITAADSSGNNRPATLQGATWAAPRVGTSAVATNGTSAQYLQAASLDTPGGVTISAWIKPAGLVGDHAFISENNSYIFKTQGSGLSFTTLGVVEHASTGVTLVADQWTHVAVSFQPGTTGGVKFYVNGVLTSTGNASAMSQGTDPTILGNASNLLGQNYDGAIDDVRVYGTILTGSRIAGIFASYPATPDPVLLSYASWATANAGGGLPNDDADLDGVPNAVEFFMGTSNSSFTPTPAMVSGSITWPRDLTANASYVIETSTNLLNEVNPGDGGWKPATAGVVDNGTSVTFTPDTSGPSLYIRLRVIIP